MPSMQAVLCAFLLCAGALGQRPSNARPLTGRVVDGDGRPVSKAKVDWAEVGTFRCLGEVETDPDGRFSLKAPEGQVWVSARAPGFAPSAKWVDVLEGRATAPLSVCLGKGDAKLKVKVTRPDGGAIPRGEAWIQEISDILAEKLFRSDVTGGAFELVLPSGTYRLRLKFPGFPDAEGFARLGGDQTLTVPLRSPSLPPGPAVKAWVRQQALPLADLRALDPVIGDSRLVGLGEATHGTHDFQAFKTRMIQHLVADKGFSFVVFEEDFTKAEVVNAYVLRGEGDPESALAQLDVNWWDTREVLELVRWMRSWNATHERKVSFRGNDTHTVSPHYAGLMAGLARVDPVFAAETAARGLDAAFIQAAEMRTHPTKETLRKGLLLADGVVAGLKERMGAWEAGTAEKVMLDARMTRQYFWRYSGVDPYMARDKVMADTVLALLEQAGEGARGILWAHNGHVGMEDIFGFRSQGGYLREALGQGYRPIGFSFNRGRFRAWTHPLESGLGELNFELGRAPADSVEGILASARLPQMAIDLRRLPKGGAVGDWFQASHPMVGIGGGFCPGEPDYMLFRSPTRVAAAFDAVVFFDRTSPIQPNPSKWSIIDLPVGPVNPAPCNLHFQAERPGSGWALTSFESEDAPPGRNEAIPAPVSVTAEGGTWILSLGCFPGNPLKVPVMGQAVEAAPYRGREVRFSARVKCGHEVRLWLRTGRSGHPSGLAVRSRKIEGGWTHMEVKARIPRDATTIAFGFASLGQAPLLIQGVALTKR